MPLNIDWQQILLHLFNFVVLFAILYFLLYKPVKEFMDKRAEYYKNLDEEAKRGLADAEKTKEEYQKKLAASDDEIAAKKKKAHTEIESAREAMIKRAEKQAQKIIADARKDIEYNRAKMLKEAQTEITDMVAKAAEKLVAQSTTSQAFDQFLGAAERGGKDE